MNLELAQAIHAVLDYIEGRDDLNPLTHDEINTFKELSERVFILAVRAGFESAIPQMANLERQCFDENLPVVQFEGKLNLPGDWTSLPEREAPMFEPVAGFRWLEDMQTLLRLAEELDTAEPLVVTYRELHQITLQQVAMKTMRNDKDRPQPISQRGQTIQFAYADCVAWWKRHRSREPLPTEAEARKRLSEAKSR